MLNPVRLREFEFILLDEKFPVFSYVEIKHGNETIYVGRVNSIYAYDLGFFSNPFRNKDDGVTASVQDFKKILSQDTEDSWRKAALLAYFSDNRSPLQIANAELVCVLQGNFPNVPECPFDAGLPVYKASKETIEKAFKKGNMPLVVGRLKGTDVSATIDFEEVLKRHIMVTGVTGSGKSYFEVHIKVFEDVLFPISGEEVIKLIIESGFAMLVQGSSNEATYIKSQLEKHIRPSLDTTLKEKTLEEVL
ncbi:MAG: DUF87 domain-containing protein [Hydrogenothermaceae bacterium]|nr:DUF87 domain-containing protein [Hydrogenothermaceae bacterium]